MGAGRAPAHAHTRAHAHARARARARAHAPAPPRARSPTHPRASTRACVHAHLQARTRTCARAGASVTASPWRFVGGVDFYESLKSRIGALAVRDFNIRKNPRGENNGEAGGRGAALRLRIFGTEPSQAKTKTEKTEQRTPNIEPRIKPRINLRTESHTENKNLKNQTTKNKNRSRGMGPPFWDPLVVPKEITVTNVVLY